MIQPILATLSFSLFFSAQVQAAVKLDSSLLRQWNQSAKLPCAVPFRATFKKDGRELTFLAVSHISGPVEPTNSELSLIAQQIGQVRPSGLLVEMDTGGKPLPKEHLKSIFPDCVRDGKFFCGEPSFAALTAGRVNPNAIVLGGEPSVPAFQSELGKKFSREEILVFTSMRAVISMKMEGIPIKDWARTFPIYLKQRLPSYSADEWSYSKISEWIRKNVGASIEQVQNQWTEPRSDAKATRLQKIAAQVEGIREPLILSSAERLINDSKKTMVVYGSSHYYKQLPVYEKAFGRPEVECLDPTSRNTEVADPVDLEATSSAR